MEVTREELADAIIELMREDEDDHNFYSRGADDIAYCLRCGRCHQNTYDIIHRPDCSYMHILNIISRLKAEQRLHRCSDCIHNPPDNNYEVDFCESCHGINWRSKLALTPKTEEVVT